LAEIDVLPVTFTRNKTPLIRNIIVKAGQGPEARAAARIGSRNATAGIGISNAAALSQF
jgi:hypothetical protein